MIGSISPQDRKSILLVSPDATRLSSLTSTRHFNQGRRPRDRILTYAFLTKSGSVVEIPHATHFRFSGGTYHPDVGLKFPAIYFNRADAINWRNAQKKSSYGRGMRVFWAGPPRSRRHLPLLDSQNYQQKI